MAKEIGRWTLLIEGTDIPDRASIGGKAHSIASMRAMGLNVPPAFVITTDACRHYLSDKNLPAGLDEEVRRGVEYLEGATGRNFGGAAKPLLLSVRSGAAISMPGMMDTILNLGLSEDAEAALAEEAGDAGFARETHRRFHQMFAKTVLGVSVDGLSLDDAPAKWREQIRSAGGDVPREPWDQLVAAVGAVFESWNARRARRYRKHQGISDDLGTAVVVQAMVFGNLDDRSGTGVLFSRNPLTGAPVPYGEYLLRAQGEDVVSGERTPHPIDEMKETLPEAYDDLIAAAGVLEKNYRDVQDIEFTVQQGELFLLQSRSAKRSPRAAVRFAVDLVEDGIIDEKTAIDRLTADQIRIVLRPRLTDDEAVASATVVAEGEPACHGVGAGQVVTDSEHAHARAEAGEAIVLARRTTSPDDVHAMTQVRAVITELGGSTSHAAVVSRALGVPCVVGCGEGALSGLEGKKVTVDGAKGKIYGEELPVDIPHETDDERLVKLISWAERHAPIDVVRSETEISGDVLDLDEVAGGDETGNYADLLDGHKAAKGGLIATDDGVRAAVAAGLDAIVADQVLPPLLTAIAALKRREE